LTGIFTHVDFEGRNEDGPGPGIENPNADNEGNIGKY
jgi:hypothetical protein